MPTSPCSIQDLLAHLGGQHTRSNAVGGQWGMMAALQGAEVAAAPISEATGHLKTVPESLYRVAEVFFA